MRAPPTAGFTLLELMVVIAIVGVVASIAGPSLSTASQRAKERQDVVAIQSLLSEARITARRLNRCVVIERVSEQQLRWITFSDGSTRCPTSPHADQSRSLKIAEGRLRVLALQGADDTNGHILFLRDGGTPYADVATVRVQGVETNQLRQFDVIPATGAVRERR